MTDEKSKMEDGEKKLFDALSTDREYWFKNYQEKTSLEWKVSFGVWALLVGTIALIVKEKLTIFNDIFFIICILFVPPVLHFMFLVWIQERLRNYRERIKTITKRIEEMLNHKIVQKDGVEKFLERIITTMEKHINTFCQPTLWMQFLTTCGLSIILGLLIFDVQALSQQPTYQPDAFCNYGKQKYYANGQIRYNYHKRRIHSRATYDDEQPGSDSNNISILCRCNRKMTVNKTSNDSLMLCVVKCAVFDTNKTITHKIDNKVKKTNEITKSCTDSCVNKQQDSVTKIPSLTKQIKCCSD